MDDVYVGTAAFGYPPSASAAFCTLSRPENKNGAKPARPAPLISLYIFRISNRGHLTGKLSESIFALK
jgi:hypothetical protein